MLVVISKGIRITPGTSEFRVIQTERRQICRREEKLDVFYEI